MRGWRTKRGVAVGLTAAILAVQLAVPISRLGDDGDQSVRFGWQMFSTLNSSIEFTVLTDDGEVDVDPSDYFARIRGDVPVAALLPPHLCEVIDGARSVTWSENTYEC